MTVYSSHWHQDILALVAAHICDHYHVDDFPNIRMLMPNRRSCIAMRQAFSLCAEGSCILPRIVPLSEIEGELLQIFAHGNQNVMDVLKSIPAAMSHTEQRLLMAQMVAAFEQKRTGMKPSFSHVLALADGMISIQNDVIREGLSIDAIDMRSLRLGDAAAHWNLHAEFLNIAFKQWPLIERERGLITAAAREQLLLRTIGDVWNQHPPSHPVWMVGSTGSMPVVRSLMKTIHSCDDGHIVLPALDLSLTQPVTVGHPQYYLDQVLSALNLARADVVLLGDTTPHARQSLWLDDAPATAEGIEYCVADHEGEEAAIISLMVREALEDPNKTVAIVVPSPALMQRIRLALMRHGVRVTTPQGEPLAHSNAGRVWMSVLRCLDEGMSILSLLELLHLPNVDAGTDASSWQSFLLAWRTRCRGVQSAAPISERLRRLADTHEVASRISSIVRKMETLLDKQLTLTQWRDDLVAFITALAPRIEEGHKAINEVLEEWSSASGSALLDSDDLVQILQSALQTPLRTPDFSVHPRVHVLSPMEARLQQFDRVILAGFNEGNWPQAYQPNPWLNLAQRNRLRMTPAEAHSTLTGHDLQMFGMAQELMITRSLKSEGMPTTPSRYLVKWETRLARAGLKLTSRPWREWYKASQKTGGDPITAPIISPPREARPSTLHVTSLRYLFQDPYAIYAQYVLGLRELDSYDQLPDASTLGSLVHRLIEEMLREQKSPDDAEWLLSHIAHLESDARLYSLWLPRIRRILAFVMAMNSTRNFDDIEMEVKKEVTVGDVTLVGKIDRLEKQGSHYSIHDYKTGAIPNPKSMEQGLEPQLIAYALMLSQEMGVLPEELIYWALPKARFEGDLVPFAGGEKPLAQHMESLKAALTQMMQEDFAFYALDANSPYAGVSRNDEWAA